jgi:hypothetical protein
MTTLEEIEKAVAKLVERARGNHKTGRRTEL